MVSARAVQLRMEGNELAQAGNATGALEKYSAALECAPAALRHLVLSNVSLVKLNGGDAAGALQAAEEAIAIGPTDWTTVRSSCPGVVAPCVLTCAPCVLTCAPGHAGRCACRRGKSRTSIGERAGLVKRDVRCPCIVDGCDHREVTLASGDI